MIGFSYRLVASIEGFQRHYGRPGLWHSTMRKFAKARYLFWSIITQSDIEPRAQLGKRLMIPHPNGVVIHEDAVIGDDCMIMQQVTIGMIGVCRALLPQDVVHLRVVHEDARAACADDRKARMLLQGEPQGKQAAVRIAEER